MRHNGRAMIQADDRRLIFICFHMCVLYFSFGHMESLMKNIHPWLVKKAGMFFMSISYYIS
jgi:hypothetical protein